MFTTKYNFFIGKFGDRLNLPVTLGISFLISYFILYYFKSNKHLFKIFLILNCFFTLFNWYLMTLYQKSYKSQLDFVQKVKSIDDFNKDSFFTIKPNNINNVSGISCLDTRWGVTFLIRSLTNFSNVEFIEPRLANLAKKNGYFDSYYLKKRIKTPDIIEIDFDCQ